MSRTLQSVFLVVVFALGVLVGTTALNTGTAQQPPMPNAAHPHLDGRYHLVFASNTTTPYLLDTATGRCWARYGNEWQDIKTPPSQDPK